MKVRELKVKLVRTCGACPEQYNAYLNDEKIGYLRLRHGFFSVSYPDADGDEVFKAHPAGDGAFLATERDHWLLEAVMALVQKHLTGDVKFEIVVEIVDPD